MTSSLLTWLPQQRWFAGKGRELLTLTELSRSPVGPADQVIVRVGYTDGGTEDYQVFLASPEIGEDALSDPEVRAALLQRVTSGTVPVDLDQGSHVLVGEQSNTSVVYADTLILKVFRRLQPGDNPDIEVTRALADVDCPNIAPPLGWLTSPVDGIPTTMALLQPFLRGASDGWAMATTSVRDLLASGDLRADEVGGDFAGEAHRLGQATGTVHRDLARAMPTAVAGPEQSRQTAAQLHERLEAALLIAPELTDYAEPLREVYAYVAGRSADVAIQRVHGDLHLGQVLRTQDRWVLLDFEGEPARPREERRALMSPLRDVAGMLRSFDYAARHLLVDQVPTPQLEFRASEWADRNRSAFCDGYAESTGVDPRDEEHLLMAFELDKAVYEVLYEARNRPHWLPVPLAGLDRLLVGA